jgi:PAS domain S-box-containing protein
MESEKVLADRDLLVSSTDKKGIIQYVNKTFSDISGYSKEELYGQPHNIIRHPDMPKAIFKFLWQNLLNKNPIVVYVKNYVKGHKEYYWVKAVIYPKVVDNDVSVITSYRTKATPFEVEQISEIYRILINYERSHSVDESLDYFLEYLKGKNLTYDKMINRINDNQQVLNTALLNLNINVFRTDHLIFRSRIESLIEKGYENIEVTKPTECAFGKRLAALEGENFAHDSKFLEIKRLHNKVHEELQLFVDTDTSKRDAYMRDVYSDIDKLFAVMEKLKNDHEHDHSH